MVGPQGAAGGISRGVDSGERAEFVGEVGLIVVSAIERHLRPGNIDARMQLRNRPLKALNAHPCFWGETDLLPKNLGEAALAPAGGSGYFANGGDARHALKPVERVVHDVVPG